MRILFVCMGNICRSPTAEGVFRHRLVGEPPDRRALAAAQRRGIDISGLRARHIASEDFEQFDLILAMDEENVRELRGRARAAYHDRIRLVMEYAPSASRRSVPDPYYGGEQGFEEVLDLLEEAADGLLASLVASSPERG